MEERWLPAPGFELTHEVSSQGRVRSIRNPSRRSGMVLKPWSDKKGYVFVAILGKTKKMHRLVLEAFSRPPRDGEEGAHLDNNPSNNRIDNLEWKTPVENSRDKFRHGTLVWGERHPAAKLSDDDVRSIRGLRAQGLMWKEIHDRFPQVSKSAVIEAGTGATFRHVDGYVAPSARAIRMRDTRSKAAVSLACRSGG